MWTHHNYTFLGVGDPLDCRRCSVSATEVDGRILKILLFFFSYCIYWPIVWTCANSKWSHRLIQRFWKCISFWRCECIYLRWFADKAPSQQVNPLPGSSSTLKKNFVVAFKVKPTTKKCFSIKTCDTKPHHTPNQHGAWSERVHEKRGVMQLSRWKRRVG